MENLGSTTISLEGMVVLDLNNQTVIRLSLSKKAYINSDTSTGYQQINGYHDRWKPQSERRLGIHTWPSFKGRARNSWRSYRKLSQS
jgi:hypothetical protein